MNVIEQRRRIFLLRCSLKVYTVILFYSHSMYGIIMQSLYYNWTRPLTLRLVRRLRRHQRIPQLAHTPVTKYPTS